MPLYFFDTDRGDRIDRDHQGVVLQDDSTVQEEARKLLMDIAHAIPAVGRSIVACVVRREGEVVVYRLMMTLDGEEPAGVGRAPILSR